NQEAEELQDALDERTEEVRQLKAAMAAAPVPPAVVDETEVQRRVQEGIAAALAERTSMEQTRDTALAIKTVCNSVDGMLEALDELMSERQLTAPAENAMKALTQMLRAWANEFSLLGDGEEE
ncbi:MAG: hypothetical protein IJ484_08920, partial [Oscillospiraceae bacterium]|nr:hypothetical protein [Oscillospiraceae bacterium]